MTEFKPSKAAALAFELLPSITDQLCDAGYDLCDGTKGVWSFSDNPPGAWDAQLDQDLEDHQRVVISVFNPPQTTWGVSYAATLCGKHQGTCYWTPDHQQLGWDNELVPLADAVLKARLLNQQEKADV